MESSEKGKKVAIVKEQSIAGRALIGWSRKHLSKASGVSMRTLARFEDGECEIGTDLIFAVWKALSEAGVKFIPATRGGPGVRLKT